MNKQLFSSPEMRRWLGSEWNDDDNMMMMNLAIILEYSFIFSLDISGDALVVFSDKTKAGVSV